MYYGPGGNRIHSWLLTKKLYHWYTITFLVIAVLICAWVFILYRPLNCLIDLEIQKMISCHEHCSQGLVAQQQCQKLEQKLKEYTRICDTACKESMGYVSFIVDQAKKADIVLSSCSCGNGSFSEECDYGAILCKLHGTTDQLLRFFDNIVQAGTYLGCTHLSLNTQDNKQCEISCQFEYML